MKKSWRVLGILSCVLCLTLVFAAGCAKKHMLTDKQAGAGIGGAAGDPSALSPEEQTAREKALKEQALREKAQQEKALKEKALREQAEKERLAKEKGTAAAQREARESAAAAKAGEVLVDIHFEFDAYSLTSKARETLQRHARWLSAHRGYSLVIEGHCDDRGTTEYNLALGERRAAETMKYLGELGIDKSRMKTISYGEEMPLDPAENEEAWAKNRRAHFVVKVK